MLSFDDIKALAKQHELDLTTRWPSVSTRGDDVPQPAGVTIFFKEDKPAAWQALMSEPVGIPVSVYGTRLVTGSGATDGTLKAAYAAVLAEVNARRAANGLARIHR